jgi:hypothetical protein
MTKTDKNKVIAKLYSVGMPIIVIILFLGISSIIDRPKFGGPVFDFIIRLLLSIWYSGMYIKLSNFSKYSHFPGITWTKEDVGKIEKYVYIGVGFIYSTGVGFITYWVILWFIPPLSDIAIAIATLNATIIFYPQYKSYWAWKL